MKYVPITSENVDELFSKYNAILTKRRTNILIEHLEKYVFINCLNT